MSQSYPSPNGDESRQGGMMATTITVTVIACIVVALRMVTRIWIVRSVGWDDYTILLATIGIIIGFGLVVVQIHYGFGRHQFYLTKWQYIEFQKYSYGEWIQTFQTLMFNKISICLFLLRIPVEKKYIRPLQGTIVFLIITNIVLTLVWIFQCNPISRSWNKETLGTCFTDAQLQRIIISQALISILSDFALALFPIVLLWKVQIEARIKAGLCTLMALGLITATCCIVRTVFNWQNVNSDPTWQSVDNWYWRSWEVCIGITTACIPTLRPAYKTLTTGIGTYLSHRSSRKAPGKSDGLVLTESNGPFYKVGDLASDIRKASSQESDGRENPNFSRKPNGAFEAAGEAVAMEADRAKAYGAGEENFAMQTLPGDRDTVDQGIKKVTRIDVDSSQPDAGERHSDAGEAERGFSDRSFFL